MTPGTVTYSHHEFVVVREPWRPDPLAWIHRAEARSIARELRAPLVEYAGELPPGRVALERCYDKYAACRINGLDTPETVLADCPQLPAAPFVLKPRRGSDSIGGRSERRSRGEVEVVMARFKRKRKLRRGGVFPRRRSATSCCG